MRRLILDAAHALFLERGYDGTTTKEIAGAAGVGESVVFRNFGSKAGLFEASITESFTNVVARWITSWADASPETVSNERITEAFIGDLYDMAVEHRDMLMTLVAAQSRGADAQLAAVADNVAVVFAESATAIRRVLLGQGSRRHFEGLDHSVTVAAVSSMALSVPLLQGWFTPPGEASPGRDRIVHELAQLVLHGITHRPGIAGPATAPES